MSKLNIFETLPEGYKRIEGQDDYDLVRDTVTRAFADACYPIPSMSMTHEEYMKLYGTLAQYWVEHSYKNGDIICNDDFSAVVLLSSMDHLCDLPFQEIRQKIGDGVNQAALDNALGILDGAGQDEKKLQVRENTIFVEIFAVRPEIRGKGDGAKIMRELFRECDALGRDLTLLTNAPKNVLLYEHLGFEELLRREDREFDTIYHYMIRRSGE